MSDAAAQPADTDTRTALELARRENAALSTLLREMDAAHERQLTALYHQARTLWLLAGFLLLLDVVELVLRMVQG